MEDNEINQEVAQEILMEAGLIVSIANNGKEAVEKVNENSYDIILMDIQMPIMDGYDATREIRKNSAFADLPIISMTTNTLLSDQEKCIQAGMNDYVAKPIDTTELFRKINHWIKKEQIQVSARKSSEKDSFLKNNDEVFHLEGVDANVGLKYLGGNLNLYRKFLIKFYKNHYNEINELKQAIEHNDLKVAERIVHTLKSIAATLGIIEVSKVAEILEMEFRANRIDKAESLLERLEQLLEQVFTAIAFLEEKNEDEILALEPFRIDILSFMPLLHKLELLLKDNDLKSAETIDEVITKAKNTPLYDEMVEMKGLINQYDFEGALEILIKLLNNIGDGLYGLPH